jgi:signal transduction histidine kinase
VTPDRAPTTSAEFYALIHPDDRQILNESLARAIREGTEYEVEFRGLLPTGDARWMAGRARLVRDAEGNPLRLLGVGMDISQRKSLEAQFRQAQKLEAVGRLAGGIAHDFNNLLTAILGYATLLGDTFETGDQRRSDLEEIRKAGERASTLTRQLLAFSRKQVVQPVPVDLNAIVDDMRPMLARLIGEDITLVTRLEAKRPIVRADPGSSNRC